MQNVPGNHWREAQLGNSRSCPEIPRGLGVLAKHCSTEGVRKKEAAPEPGVEASSSCDVHLAPSNERA